MLYCTADGATPLFIAAYGGRTDIAEWLIAAGANVDKRRTDDGVTPLYIAVEQRHERTVQLLIAAGASVDLPHTALGGAVQVTLTPSVRS